MNAIKPTTRQLINRSALVIVAAYALTTIHHIYGEFADRRASNRLYVPIFMAIPSLVTLGSLYRYKRTGSGAALATLAAVPLGRVERRRGFRTRCRDWRGEPCLRGSYT